MSNVIGNGSTGGGVGITQLNVDEGLVNQLLTTDGAGNLSFTTVETNIANEAVGGDVSGVVSNIQLRTNVVGINELNVQDGQSNHVLTTNGSGTLSWSAKSDPSGTSVGGDVSGTVSNIQLNANVVRTNEIIDNAITNTKLAVNSVSTLKIIDLSVTEDKLATDCISTIKILDASVTNDKIVSIDASKLTGGLGVLDGSLLTNLPYDTSWVGGFDSDMIPEDLIANGVYGEVVMSRNGTFLGEVGYLDVQATGSALIVDIEKNGASIYSTRPQFAISAPAMTSGTMLNNVFASGDRITLKVIQVGSGTIGRGLRFTLNGKAPS